jgi:hypothetical protein
VVTDVFGAQLQLNGARLSLLAQVDTACPAAATACAPIALPPEDPVSVAPQNSTPWIELDSVAAVPTALTISFVPVSQDSVLVPGSSAAFGGTLGILEPDLSVNVVPFAASFPWNGSVTVVFPDARSLATKGQRYRLVADPSVWLIDPTTGLAPSLANLTGVFLSLSNPEVQAVWQRLMANLHLEAY